jgi:hypothetical protein
MPSKGKRDLNFLNSAFGHPPRLGAGTPPKRHHQKLDSFWPDNPHDHAVCASVSQTKTQIRYATGTMLRFRLSQRLGNSPSPCSFAGLKLGCGSSCESLFISR